MMFATVYFHHTTRMFERVLQQALRELWPDPRALDPIDDSSAGTTSASSTRCANITPKPREALRERVTVYGLAAEFNAERDLSTFAACEAALRERFGDAVWGDSQEQLLHRLPLGSQLDADTV